MGKNFERQFMGREAKQKIEEFVDDIGLTLGDYNDDRFSNWHWHYAEKIGKMLEFMYEMGYSDGRDDEFETSTGGTVRRYR